MAACASAKANRKDNGSVDSCRCNEASLSQSREIIKPSIVELTKEVRTNILCTVEGCGKILPNTPALNMHLVKSHRVKVNPEILRKQSRRGLYESLGVRNSAESTQQCQKPRKRKSWVTSYLLTTVMPS